VTGALGNPARITSARENTGGQTPWSTQAAAGRRLGRHRRAAGVSSSIDLDHVTSATPRNALPHQAGDDYAPFEVTNAWLEEIELSGISYLMGAGTVASPARGSRR